VLARGASRGGRRRGRGGGTEQNRRLGRSTCRGSRAYGPAIAQGILARPGPRRSEGSAPPTAPPFPTTISDISFRSTKGKWREWKKVRERERERERERVEGKKVFDDIPFISLCLARKGFIYWFVLFVDTVSWRVG
jgi:hypothetical protein